LNKNQLLRIIIPYRASAAMNTSFSPVLCNMILIFRIAMLKVFLIKLDEFKQCYLDYFLQLVVCPHFMRAFFCLQITHSTTSLWRIQYRLQT